MTEDIRLDPAVVRNHAQRLTRQGTKLSTTAEWALLEINQRDSALSVVDQLVHAFVAVYEPRAKQAADRARAGAKEFVDLGEMATAIVDAYERVDVDTAVDLARERGLLPPR